MCVTKDSKFIKGYYRLATAQTELHLFDDASTTLQTALKIEPENDQLLKQVRVVKSKRAAAASAVSKARPAKQLDEAQRKEFDELRDQVPYKHSNKLILL